MAFRIIIVFLLGFKLSLGQDYNVIINTIQKENQDCLDKGDKMYTCSRVYLKQTDSILNVVYRNVRKHLSDTEKQVLKKEQIQWIKAKDSLFNAINKESSPLGNGLDAKMDRNQRKADFNIERTKYLIDYKIDKR